MTYCSYQKIYSDLKKKIVDGDYKIGDMMPSIHEVKDQYGVSHITAMRALKELTNDNFLNAIKGKGYFVKSTQSPLLDEDNLTRVIAYVARPSRKSTIYDNYLNDLNQGFVRTCQSNSFHVLLPFCALPMSGNFPDDSCLESIKNCCRQLRHSVDGFAFDERIPDEIIKSIMTTTSKPAIIVNRRSSLEIDSVVSDNFGGIEAAVDLCLKLRYDYFIICRNLYSKVNHEERTNAFIDQLLKRNVSQSRIKEIDYCLAPFEETYDDILDTLRSGANNLIFSPTDHFARWLLDTFLENNHSIPGIAGILGGNGMGYSTMKKPHITTIDLNPQEIGEKAASLLVDKILKKHFAKPKAYLVPTSLSLGQTI